MWFSITCVCKTTMQYRCTEFLLANFKKIIFNFGPPFRALYPDSFCTYEGTKIVWFKQMALLQCESLYVSAALPSPSSCFWDLSWRARLTLQYCIYKLLVIAPTIDTLPCWSIKVQWFRLHGQPAALRRRECVTSWLRLTWHHDGISAWLAVQCGISRNWNSSTAHEPKGRWNWDNFWRASEGHAAVSLPHLFLRGRAGVDVSISLPRKILSI